MNRFHRVLLVFIAWTLALETPHISAEVLPTAVKEAVHAIESGAATPFQRALAFEHNDLINAAALTTKEISADAYHAAQLDYTGINQGLAQQATVDADGVFSVQVGGRPSPGTDSDFIVRVTSRDPVGQISNMQKDYNRRVNNFLRSAYENEGVAFTPRNNWHNKLDVDFMADPKHLTQYQFEQVARLNNDAYRRRRAAVYEAASRAKDGTKVFASEFRDYTNEMREFIGKKQKYLAKIRKNPGLLHDPLHQAEFHRLMAQEQKYISRVESVAVTLRGQEGLTATKELGPYHKGEFEPKYEIRWDKDGNPFLVKNQQSLASVGAKRFQANFNNTAIASAVSENSLQRTLRDISVGMAEAAGKDSLRWSSYADDIAQITGDIVGPDGSIIKGLSASAKGDIIDTIRNSVGEDAAAAVARAMRAHTTPTAGSEIGNILRAERAALPTMGKFIGGNIAMSAVIGALTHSTDPKELAQFVLDDLKLQAQMVGQGWREIGNLAVDAVYTTPAEQQVQDAQQRLLEIFNEQNEEGRAFDIVPNVAVTPGIAGGEDIYGERDVEFPKDVNGNDIVNLQQLEAALANGQVSSDLGNLLAQIRENVYLGRPPLQGIARVRQKGQQPVGFNDSIAAARSALAQRDGIYQGIYRDLDRKLRALADVEDKLAKAEDASSGDPEVLEQLRKAVEQLRHRIDEIKDKKKRRNQQLAAIMAEMQTRSAKICDLAAQATLEAEGSKNPHGAISAQQKRDMVKRAQDDRKTMSDLADTILEQTELPVSELRKEMTDVSRLKREFLKSMGDSEDGRSEDQVDLAAIRASLDAAMNGWNEEQVRIREKLAQDLQEKALKLLSPWSRQRLASELIQQALNTPAPPADMLPEDELPTETGQELDDRLKKLEEAASQQGESDERPDDVDEVLKTAQSTFDEANEIQRLIAQDAYLRGQGIEPDENSLAKMLNIDTDNDPAKIPQLLNRFDECRRAIEETLEEEHPTPTTIVDSFAALDPTHAFDKRQWTLSQQDEAERHTADPQSPGENVAEEKSNPFEGKAWTLAAKDPDPAKQPKPIVPVVPETPFRTQDFDLTARPTTQPSQPATKYPFDVYQPPPRQPSQPATKYDRPIAARTPVKHGTEIPAQPAYSQPRLVSVPDVRGLPVQQAGEVIAKAGLTPAFTVGTAASNPLQQYHVYAQQPAPRSRVLPGSGVRVVFFNKPHTQLVAPATRTPTPAHPTTKTPTEITPAVTSKTPAHAPKPTREIPSQSTPPTLATVPNVAGLSAGNASKQIRQAGLKPSFNVGTEAPSQDKSYIAYVQSPEAGQRVAMNSSVQVTIYGNHRAEPSVAKNTRSTPNRPKPAQTNPPTATPNRQIPATTKPMKEIFTSLVTVPMVIGKSQAEAKGMIERAGLKAKVSLGTIADSKDREQLVYSQEPRAGRAIDRGATVDVHVYRDMSAADGTVAGNWKCSCGAKWTFSDTQGSSGKEFGSGWSRPLHGSLNGQYLRFSWTSDSPSEAGGSKGTGVIAFNKSFTRGNWRMTNERGQSWEGTITKDDGRDHRQTFNTAGINISNRTGEVLYLDIRYRSNASGAWKDYSTTATIPASYSGPLKDSRGNVIAASAISITTRGASGRRYGELQKDLVTDGPYKADTMGMHNLNIERRR